MELDAEQMFVKYSRLRDGNYTDKEKETILILSQQKVKDNNIEFLEEESQLDEKAMNKRSSLKNNHGQQTKTKILNPEGKVVTNVQVEFLNKWTIGLSLMFLLVIVGLVIGLLILASQIQDLKLQNKHMQNDLKSKDQMIQKLELQNQSLTLNLEKLEVAKELVKHFLDMEEHCNEEPDDSYGSDTKSFTLHKNILHKAAEKGDLKKVALLLELGEDVNGLNKLSPYGSYTALHEAAKNGHHDVVELLLQNGASTNITHDR